jgi:hypothetical protein
LKEYLFQIELGYAYAGVVCNKEGIIITAAPILRWSIGKHFRDFKEWKNIKSIHKCWIDGIK